jgi:hypothetical protein
MVRQTWTLPKALAVGTLAVGALDLLDAFVFFGARYGVAPIRILHSIASGLLGRAAYAGGVRTGVLGLFLHFLIAFLIVGTYLLASHRLPVLASRPWLFGPLYGVVAYLVMNFVVVPLSAAGSGSMALPIVVNGLMIHMFGVGLPAAFVANRTIQD